MELSVEGKAVFAATGGRAFDPALPLAIFVHGAGMDHTVWALQARYFAHHGRAVLAPDLPGHGRSEGPPLDSIAAIADWLAVLIAASGAEAATLVGHSMGALAALDCAARHGGRVSDLALLGCAPKMPVHPDLLAAAEENRHVAFELVNDWGHGRPAHLGGHRAPGLWMLGGGERLLERSAPGALHRDLLNCDAYRGAATAAAAVACPCLVVIGSEDRMTPPKAGAKLAAAIANARSVTIAGSGHMMMVEKPDEALDALRSLL